MRGRRCDRCTLSFRDWRHTMLCVPMLEKQTKALAQLVILDAQLRGEYPDEA